MVFFFSVFHYHQMIGQLKKKNVLPHIQLASVNCSSLRLCRSLLTGDMEYPFKWRHYTCGRFFTVQLLEVPSEMKYD